MKIYCGKCKVEMTDHGGYVQCNSGKCDIETSSHSIPLITTALYKYQLTGTIIIEEGVDNIEKE